MLKCRFNKQSFCWHQLDLHNSKFHNSRNRWAFFFNRTWGMKGYMDEIILSRMAGVFLQNSEWLLSLVIRVGKLSESSFRSVFSLTKQPTFQDATTGCPGLGSDTSSEWNFCSRFSDFISWGNQWWCHKMSAVFSG